MNEELQSAWPAVIANLSSDPSIGPATVAFLQQAQLLGELGSTVLLAVPNNYLKNMIETRLRETITAALQQQTGKKWLLAVTVDEALEANAEPTTETVTTLPPQAEVPPASNVSDLPVASPAAPLPEQPQPVQTPPAFIPAHPEITTLQPQTEQLQRPFQPQRTAAAYEESGVQGAAVAPAGLAASGVVGQPYTQPVTKLHHPPAPENGGHLQVVSSQLQTNAEKAHLNSKYTFDTFVIGSSNRFAHAAATTVAENPAHAYNPLFIWGGSGLGKTHLLHAIGHYAMSLYPGITVRYVNSEEFTNDFINSISSGRAEDFQGRYRNVDILLIDDIQFLQGKEQTIEEFFHTFNALHNQEKQVVITSDVPPKKLSGFEERLQSRFTWGLLTDVQPPNLETRIAILQNKALAENVQADDDVLEYIASRFATNIRELEGALLRVTAFASLNKQPISLALAEMVLKDIVSDPQDAQITPALIKAQTAGYFNLTVEQLCSADRSRNITEARQIAMYLCRELTDLSLPKIGDEFNRDHTTVMHANKRIPEAMRSKPTTFNHVTELTNRIKQAAREAN